MNAFMLGLLSVLPVMAMASPSVAIDAGLIEGGKCDNARNAVYSKRIPYAEPPIGDLRFEPPRAYNQEFPNGKLDATKPAPACIQFGNAFAETEETISEDCLYLDVWAPADAMKESKLPVKVWVYGGSDTTGGITNSLYDGCNIAEEGALLVSINYRLGPLGFMALNSAGIYGNQGIQDLILGLHWVQDNIAGFGGDPKKVLLFGQSAGAEDAFVVASLPQAPSLMSSMISESGAGKYLAINSTLQRTGVSYARTLHCTSSDKACLQSKSVKELLKAFNTNAFLSQGIGADGSIGISSPGQHTFYPYVDGNTIPEEPVIAGVQVPSVFGSNRQEGAVYTALQFIVNGSPATPTTYKDFLQKNFGSAAALVGKYYPLSLFKAYGEMAVQSAISQVITDAAYKCIAYEGLMQAARKNIPVWTYEFTHAPTCPWIQGSTFDTISVLGASHTAEIPYVFGNPAYSYNHSVTCAVSAGEQRLSKDMMSLWTAMAENADPSTEDIEWPQFQARKSFVSPGLVFANSTTLGSVNYTSCELWTQIYPMMAERTPSAVPTGTPSATLSSTPSPYTGGAATLLPTWGLIGLSAVWMMMVGLV